MGGGVSEVLMRVWVFARVLVEFSGGVSEVVVEVRVIVRILSSASEGVIEGEGVS